MRRYDDQVDVRTGDGYESASGRGLAPGSPAQFLWRGQLWQVRAVLAHWVETGEWWRGSRARAVVGTDNPEARGASTPARGAVAAPADALAGLLEEREVWRVEARRPVPYGGDRAAGGDRGAGVFDLARDSAAGRWQLLGCSD